MKKAVLLLPILCVILLTASCDGADEEGKLVLGTLQPYSSSQATEYISFVTPSPSFPTVSMGVTPFPVPSFTASPTYVPSASAAPTPTNSASMYSSYADMKTFDPLTGWAQFDFWDMLQGDEAVAWMVAHEGKTEAEAQAIVDDWGDSEYIKKNVNPQLRTIDLSSVPVYMLQFPYGYDLSPDPDPVLTSFADLCSLYAADPDILLENLFYYYVTVDSGGTVTAVSQCYHP